MLERHLVTRPHAVTARDVHTVDPRVPQRRDAIEAEHAARSKLATKRRAPPEILAVEVALLVPAPRARGAQGTCRRAGDARGHPTHGLRTDQPFEAAGVGDLSGGCRRELPAVLDPDPGVAGDAANPSGHVACALLAGITCPR